LTGGGSRKSKGLRRDSESSRSGGGLNCDLLSLATVRSHSSRGGRFQGENNSSDKEEGGACLIEKEGSRSTSSHPVKPIMGKGERKEAGRTLRFGQPIILAVPVN